jgi:exopolysaccharide production protein ExoY
MEALLRVSRKFNIAGVVERAAGGFLLAAACPVIAVSGAAIFLLSRKSPFIAHLRVGQGGRLFWMWKLRTMWSRKDSQDTTSAWVELIVAEPSNDNKDPRDQRVTNGLARFLRRHSIDEIPQLWNVVLGEMAFVGPRPLTRTELVKHYGAIAAEVLSVKPGVTGLWQIRGRNMVKFGTGQRLDAMVLCINLAAHAAGADSRKRCMVNFQ